MMTTAVPEPQSQPADAFVPIEVARALVGRDGKPVAKQTVFSLGVRQELDVRMIAGRFVVTRDSINAYRRRNDMSELA